MLFVANIFYMVARKKNNYHLWTVGAMQVPEYFNMVCEHEFI